MELLGRAIASESGVLHRLVDLFETGISNMRKLSQDSSMDAGTREALGHEIAHMTSAVAKVKEAMETLDGLAFTEPPVEDESDDEPALEWKIGHMESVVKAFEESSITGERLDTAKATLADLRSLAAKEASGIPPSDVPKNAPGSIAKGKGSPAPRRSRRRNL